MFLFIFFLFSFSFTCVFLALVDRTNRTSERTLDLVTRDSLSETSWLTNELQLPASREKNLAVTINFHASLFPRGRFNFRNRCASLAANLGESEHCFPTTNLLRRDITARQLTRPSSVVFFGEVRDYTRIEPRSKMR